MIVPLIMRVARAFQSSDATVQERGMLRDALQGVRTPEDLPSDAMRLLESLEARQVVR